MTRARRIKVEFSAEEATGRGGAAVFEQAFRSLGVRRMLERHLPQRVGEYTSARVGEQVLAGLLSGGRGFQAAQILRNDGVLARLFGHERVAEEATVWRAMCDMAGLDQRSFDKVYCDAGAQTPRLDMAGALREESKHRRIVAAEPEAMKEENRGQFDALLVASARRCAKATPREAMFVCGMLAAHVDGSDLEVKGRCFDAARKNHEGDMSIRLMTLRIGPYNAAMRVLPGASDEGHAMPGLIRAATPLAKEIAVKAPMLALIDSAGAEASIITELEDNGWLYLIGANQWRKSLQTLAEQQPENLWRDHGADAGRGWSCSQTAVFTHQPESLTKPVTVIVRRWRTDGELGSMPWHYSFLYTNTCEEKHFKKHADKHGFAQACWMVYSTKQGHENHFKTLLSDLGGHHPASGRLGATEVFLHFAALAANIWSAISHKAAALSPKKSAAPVRHFRFLREMLPMAARLAMQAGRTLLVRLLGGGLDKKLLDQWLLLWTAAGRL